MAGKLLPVKWSAQSVGHGIAIREYLLENFSQKEVDKFFMLLEKFERNVSRFPKLLPCYRTEEKSEKSSLA